MRWMSEGVVLVLGEYVHSRHLPLARSVSCYPWQHQEVSIFSDAVCCLEQNENLLVRLKGKINIGWIKISYTHLKPPS